MIYNSDFVTNSSSTSFVLMTKDKKTFTLAKFLNAAHVDKKSPLSLIYTKLFELIQEGIIKEVFSLKEILNDYRVFDGFSKQSKKEIKKRIKNGEKAYVGNISDDSSIGAFFLSHKVIIIGDTFYFNWEPDAY